MSSNRIEVSISNRTLFRILAVAAAFLLLLYAIYLVRSVVTLVVVAAFLALALNPLVVALERRGLGRTAASLIVFLVAAMLLIAFLAAILTPLYAEVRQFADNLPGYVRDLRESRLLRDLNEKYDIFERLQKQSESLGTRLPATATSLLGLAGVIFSAVFRTLTVLFLTLFLLLELPAISAAVRSLLAPQAAERAERLQAEINTTIARYVAGNLAISVIAGLVTYVSLLILGVPFAVVLALLVALFDLIPLVGATIGSAVVVGVAFTQGVVPGVAMVVISLLYQQAENHVIQPIVMRKSVSVSPFIVLVSVLLGSTLLGVLGALLAIPVAGSLQIALREVIESRRARVA